MVQEGLAVAVEYISFDLTSSKLLFEIVISGVCAKTLRENNNRMKQGEIFLNIMPMLGIILFFLNY
jgi:hypothetical protein